MTEASITNSQTKKVFNLAERTRLFAGECRALAKQVKHVPLLRNDVQQLIRSSGSVAANYLEADEALSKKDFLLRIKICRKEARESTLWLDLMSKSEITDSKVCAELREEAYQLVKIFNAIVVKSS